MHPALRQMQRIVATETPDDLWSLAVEIFADHGFDRATYGISHSDHLSLSAEDQDLTFFSHLDPGGAESGFDIAFFMRTPMFRWVIDNRGACSWSWAHAEFAAGRLSPNEEAALQQRRKQGMEAGYTLSFVDPALRGRGVLSLVARPGLSQDEVDARWQQEGAALELICEVMHLKMRSLPLPIRRRRLSPRQREALEWVAAGKTTQDIATIMGVSPAMVEKHLKLVRETLDVSTTAHAVAKAAMLNHLFAVDESKLFGRSALKP